MFEGLRQDRSTEAVTGILTILWSEDDNDNFVGQRKTNTGLKGNNVTQFA